MKGTTFFLFSVVPGSQQPPLPLPCWTLRAFFLRCSTEMEGTALFHLHSLQARELQRGWRTKCGMIPSFPQKIPCSHSLPGLGPGWHRSLSHPALLLQKNVRCTLAVTCTGCTLVDPGMMLFINIPPAPGKRAPCPSGCPAPLDPAYVPFLERQ